MFPTQRLIRVPPNSSIERATNSRLRHLLVASNVSPRKSRLRGRYAVRLRLHPSNDGLARVHPQRSSARERACLTGPSTRTRRHHVMKTPIALALATGLLAGMPAVAAPDEAVVREMARQTRLSVEEIRRDYDACNSGVTRSMKICGAYRWLVEDARLNRIYRQLLSKARESGVEPSLVQAQRAWLAYRDAACDFEGRFGAGGGTAEGLHVLSCKLELTKQRADHLAASLHE